MSAPYRVIPQFVVVCGCGCGEPVNIAPYNKVARGYVAGQPFKFVQHHGPRKSAADRFAAHHQASDAGCWEWAGCKNAAGYGKLVVDRRWVYAHRYSHEFHKGPIPDGMVIDHLCRNTSCVNPDHLEAVTPRENNLRGLSPAAERARWTHCPRGHEYTPENTGREARASRRPNRACLACARIRSERKRKDGDL